MSKKIAPIIIVVIAVGYFLLVMLGITESGIPQFPSMELWLFVFALLFIGYIIISLIITLVKRMKEIDKEGQDDLSKY